MIRWVRFGAPGLTLAGGIFALGGSLTITDSASSTEKRTRYTGRSHVAPNRAAASASSSWSG